MTDKWVKNDYVFICDGKGYCTTPSGGTVCIGPVDDEGNALENFFKPAERASDGEDVVSKLSPNDNLLTDENSGSFETPEIEEKPKHPGGRPRKTDDDLSRSTKWRRQKEMQGVLF